MRIIRTYSFKITYAHYNHFQNEKPGPKISTWFVKLCIWKSCSNTKIKSHLAMHLANQGLLWKKNKIGLSKKNWDMWLLSYALSALQKAVDNLCVCIHTQEYSENEG